MKQQRKNIKKLKFQERPTCSCGVKMKLVEYRGYYESFKYFRCDNCTLDDTIQSKEIITDDENIGAYSR